MIRIRPGYLWRGIVGVVSSLLCAGIFYFIWMATFLLTIDLQLNSPVVEIMLWLSAPIITAAGFATGIVIFERLITARKTGFFRVFMWPLIGCSIGAVAVYWFGPMLIVFSMLAAGTASIVLREATRKNK